MILELQISIWEDQMIKNTIPVLKSLLITAALN